MAEKDYEIIPVEPKDIRQSHVLTGRISKIGRQKDKLPNLGKADVVLDDYGLIENVEVFYHCENSNKAKGTETLNIPFREKDQVIVINFGDIKNLDPDKMKIVGFKDGLPRYCTTQVVYVKIVKGYNIQRCFIWDVEKNEFATIKDSNGDIIPFPCDARGEIEDWLRKQTNVTRSIFKPSQTCGKERPDCPEWPDNFSPYPSHEWSDTIETSADCELGPEECPCSGCDTSLPGNFCDICSKSTWAATGEEWPYKIGKWPLPPIPFYYTPTSNGNSDHVLTHVCDENNFHSIPDSFRFLMSFNLPAKEFKDDENGYFRTQHEYTVIGHMDEVLPTGTYPPYDDGYGEGHSETKGTIKTFTHFCEGEKDDECIRNLEYSVIGNFGYNRSGGPQSGTLTITNWPTRTSSMGQTSCSNKIVVHIFNVINKTFSAVNKVLGQTWYGGGTAWEYGEKSYKAYLDIIAQVDFYSEGTEDIKVRELKRNPEFEQAVRDLDNEVRESAGLLPIGGESGNDPVEYLLPTVLIYEINRVKEE